MTFFNTLHETVNIPLLQYMNSFTDNTIVGNIVFFMADMPIFFIPVFLVVMWFVANSKKDTFQKMKLLFITYSMVFAVIVSTIIQQFVSLERPEESIRNAGKLILEHIPDASFPSDHASVGMAFLVGLFLFGFKKTSLIVAPFFIVMLISRISGGLHWPFDILVGSIIGAITAITVYKSRNFNIFKKTNEGLIKLASFFKL